MTDAQPAPRVRPFAETKPVDQFPGVIRRTLVSGARMTLVQIDIEAGAEVPEHTHPHEQAGTVVRGRIAIRIGAAGTPAVEVAPGGSYLIPGGDPHHVRAIEAATLVEVFAPVREEFAGD